MVILGQIRGQTRAVDLLRRAMAQGRVPHAYLFAGPEGCGKHTTALALAAAMNCEQAPGEGCGVCAACERIGAGIHPDVVTLERQGASQTIPIEVIRKQVIPALGMAPHEARARFFLIEEATCLLGPSANALLKTLEEPPARTHFVLCTASAGEILPTIRSRSQKVVFQALPAGARAADGEPDPVAAQVDELLAAVARGDRMRQAQLAEALAGERGEVARAARLCAQRLHDAAVVAAGEGDLERARVLGAQAMRALDCEMALTVHNTHALMAMERLVRELGALS
jgi:DNA polymerase-3 subunit delta'